MHSLFSLLGVAATPTIAQIPAPPMGDLGRWFWSATTAIGLVVLLLTLIIQCRRAFGRTPPLSDVIAGLATLKHVSDIQAEMHMRSHGLEEQISGLRREMRGEYQATAAVQQELSEEFVEQIQGVRDKIESSFDALDNRRRTDIRDLHAQLTETKVRLGEVSAAGISTDRKLDSMDIKLGRLVEHILTGKGH